MKPFVIGINQAATFKWLLSQYKDVSAKCEVSLHSKMYRAYTDLLVILTKLPD